ncbi:MAG: MMPL family transporter [Leptospiraceae bacterium]|nr:MMPL family transporter [Leptospiraceae bacterium]
MKKYTEWMVAIPEFSFRRRWWVISFFVLFTVGLGFGLPKLKVDMTFDTWLDAGDSTLLDYQRFRYFFGSDEYMMIMFKPKGKEVFDADTLKKVNALEDALNKKRFEKGSPLNRITRIRTIISADFLESKGDTLKNRKFIGSAIPDNKQLAEIKKFAMAQRHFPGSWFSKDSQFGAILILTDYGARIQKLDEKGEAKPSTPEFDFTETQNAKKDRNKIPKMESADPSDYMKFNEELGKVLKEQKWVNPTVGEANCANMMGTQPSVAGSPSANPCAMEYLVGGGPWVASFFMNIMTSQMGQIMGLSVLLIFITLAIAFRSLSAMIWPTLIIILSVIWTLGLVGLSNVTMTMMINIVAILNLTVGISSSVHILSGYKYYLVTMDKRAALIKAYEKSGVSVMLATLTTFAGIMSMVVVPIVPIRNFAIAASLGIAFAYIGTIYLLPSLLTIWAPGAAKNKKTGEKMQGLLERQLQRFISYIIRVTHDRPKTIVAIFSVIMLLSLTGYPRVVVDTNFLESIKPGYGFKETFETLDTHFGGTTNVEIIINTGKNDGLKDVSLLTAMDNLAQRAKKERPDFVAKTTSLVNAVKDANKNLTNGKEENYRIPSDNQKLKQVLLMYDSADPESRRLFADDDWEKGRITLQVVNKSSFEYTDFLTQVEGWMKEYLEPVKKTNPELTYYATGGIPIMMRLTGFLTKSQLQSFGLALVIITIIMFLIYGTMRYGFIAMLPNIFPILLTVGVTGWFKIPLDSDTLLVLPIAIGIAVDDTIHFLTHYRGELLAGHGRLESIKTTLREVGQAMIFTSIILVTGFLIFLSSIYVPFRNFGLLSAIAISSALIADLFFLPALLVAFGRSNKVIGADT